MIPYFVLPGATSVSVCIRIIDATDGTPETGVVFNTTGMDMHYQREGAASVAITEVTLAALTTAWTSGGFLHRGNGYYRLDVPNAAFAAGASGVLIHGSVTDMVVIGCYVHLSNAPVDVRAWLGTTAATPTVAGVPEVDITHLVGSTLSATDLKDFVDAGYDPATNKVQGVVLTDTVTTYTGNTPQTGDSFARIGATGSGLTTLATQASLNTVDDFLDTEIVDIKTVTDSLTALIAALQSDLDNIQTRLAAALTGAGNMKVDVLAVDGDANAAANLRRGVLGNVLVSVGTGSTPTSIATSSMTPSSAVIGQFAGRIFTFSRDTTTVNLRGQARSITGNTAAGVLTCEAFTNSPVAGDSGVIT